MALSKLGPVTAIALSLTACGGGGGGTETTPVVVALPPAPPPVTAPAPSPTPAPAPAPTPAPPPAPAVSTEGVYEVNYGQFSGIYTFLSNGDFYGLHFVSNGTVLAGHPHGKLTAANSTTVQESISWANFIDDVAQTGAQEPAGVFGRSFGSSGLSVSIGGSMGSFTATAAAQKTWAADSSSTLYLNPVPLTTLTGTYAGVLRTVGNSTAQQSVSNFVVATDGSFTASAANCTFNGRLVQHGSTGIFDATAQTGGAGCKLNANLAGIATPLSVAGNIPQLGIQLNSLDNTQTAVFVVAKGISTVNPTPPAPVSFTLTSTSFAPKATIPVKYTCDGGETSPQLQWAITSDAVKSFALIMEDPDAVPIVGYPYVHWNIYQIPATTREITEGASRRAMPAGSAEGANDDFVYRYSGPCPPTRGGVHRYIFALYALNTDKLIVDTTHPLHRSEFEKNFANLILQKVETQGNFGH